MAVTTGTINVNSGSAGWNRAHVMTALETVFGSSHLNWNSGTQQTGVPVCCLYPGQTATAASMNGMLLDNAGSNETRIFGGSGSSSLWDRCGGGAVSWTLGGADSGHVDGKNGYSATRYLYVTNNGTTNYLIQDELIPASSNQVSSNVITLSHSMGSNLTSGTKVTYNGQGTNATGSKITGLVAGTAYYMRRIGPNKITLHETKVGAEGNSALVTCSSNNLTDALRFRTDPIEQSSSTANPTITVKRGEKLYWYDHAVTQGNFRICDVTTTSGAYNAERVLSDSSKFQGTKIATSYAISGQGTYADPWYWQTAYYPQTETEVYNPQKVSGTGYTGLFSYGYCNDAQSNLKGSVVLLPDHNNEMRTSNAGDSFHMPYWKVTVSGSQGDTDNSGSGRTNIKLRVYRDCYSHNEGEISHITVNNVATGWSAGDEFQIPGEDIGGVATTNDIDFGTNAYSSGTDNTPSILVTNHGAGNNMFQKHPSGDFSVLRMENESGKTFGTTYWAFAIDDNNYNMYVKSGCAWQTLNSLGTNSDSTGSNEYQYGVFGGDSGLDVQAGASGIERTPGTASRHSYLKFATTSSPTNYPLKIRYYKAASPQDTNFAVIQFIQHIDSVDEPFACFTLHRGSTFGSSVWDLNHVWNGTYTEYKTQYQEQNNSPSNRDRWIDMKYITPSYMYYNSARPHHEPADYYTLAREASYGYLRNGAESTSIAYTDVRYSPNIMTTHEGDADTAEVYTYYRDQTLDKSTGGSYDAYGFIVQDDGTNSVSSSAAYYKPIKGIPINNRFAPCPYYLPDDFVFIQVEVTPPATVFRPGDTVTVASGEVYTIINCDNQVDQDGLDGGTDNVAIGMLFAARTT